VIAALCALSLGGAPWSRADSIPSYVAKAVGDVARPPGQMARDAHRKPAELIAFAGIKPGESVIDLMPGSGY
jgi:predicted methyltransferase